MPGAHVRGREHAVPVNRGVDTELVANPQRDVVALAPTQDRARQRAVRERRGPRSAREAHFVRADHEIDLRAAQRRDVCGRGERRAPRQPGTGARDDDARREPLLEPPPRRRALQRPRHSFTVRSRSALPITDTDDRLIARLASAGDSSRPSAG